MEPGRDSRGKSAVRNATRNAITSQSSQLEERFGEIVECKMDGRARNLARFSDQSANTPINKCVKVW